MKLIDLSPFFEILKETDLNDEKINEKLIEILNNKQEVNV